MSSVQMSSGDVDPAGAAFREEQIELQPDEVALYCREMHDGVEEYEA